MARHLPNALSCVRIVLSLVLLGLAQLNPAFITIYLLAGVTDALDGYTARRLGVTSVLGATLDSIGDFCFCGAAVVSILRHFLLPTWLIAWGVGVAVARLACWGLAYLRARMLGLHTLADKLCSAMLFCALPIAYLAGTAFWAVVATAVLGTLAAAYDFIVILTRRHLAPDHRSFFDRFRRAKTPAA